MAKSKNKTSKNKPARKQRPAENPQNTGDTASSKSGISRRSLLLLAGAAPLAIAGGYGIHQYDIKNKELHDLSVIGEGQPVVLQIHDPSCQLCNRLKSSTQNALGTMADTDIQYRIANLTTRKGRELGSQYGVGKVTLLLFDGSGEHVHTVQGVTPPEELVETFEHYL